MTCGGWICMSIAVSSIFILTFWCCWKVVTNRDDQSEIPDPFELYDDK